MAELSADMLHVTPQDLPGNVHEVSPGNPARVIRSRFYRLSWAGIIDAADLRHAGLAGVFPAECRPTGSFGAAGLESQEHSILWVGDPDVIAGFTADPIHQVPWDAIQQTGIRADRWPDTGGWPELIPAGTWNPGGQGIVTEFDFHGAKVIVYELLGQPGLLSAHSDHDPGGPVPVVTWHCTRCHMASDAGGRILSGGPEDRRTAGLRARKHMRPGNCRGDDGSGDRMVAAVRSAVSGVTHPADAGLYASWCATAELDTGSRAGTTCAEVREARLHTARNGRPPMPGDTGTSS